MCPSFFQVFKNIISKYQNNIQKITKIIIIRINTKQKQNKSRKHKRNVPKFLQSISNKQSISNLKKYSIKLLKNTKKNNKKLIKNNNNNK